MKNNDKILILDFGSQYTQLILRKLREIKISAEIHSYSLSEEKIKEINPKGIILSGGPSSVYEPGAPIISSTIFELGIPVLGICYGMQLMSYLLGGKVENSSKREFGNADLILQNNNSLFEFMPISSVVWMSHSDKVIVLPDGFELLASSLNTRFAAIGNYDKKLFGIQFHPEVYHTVYGKTILENFCCDICFCKKNWITENIIHSCINDIKEKSDGKKVFCALSGGVDSTVAAVLARNAIGSNLVCIHIDNGLMRLNESRDVLEIFNNNLNLNVNFVDASALFLSRLKGIIDPEKKRKIIGNTFIEVFENEIIKYPDVEYLIQGTLYPDVIESSSSHGHSKTIKTHHNVGGLPDKMKFKLIEPLRNLYKDEVRELGKHLNIPSDFLNRHPFPGPGLAVRIIGEITNEKIELLKKADKIFIDELISNNLYHKAWQAFTVILPVKTVGVMGDNRTYDYTVALRAVDSRDGMTAECVEFDLSFLKRVSYRIVNEINGINRVVYDLTSKPPATIEWE